jgi:hypothetical protein
MAELLPVMLAEMGPKALSLAAEYGPQAISAASTGYTLGKKYIPKMIGGVKRLANNLFSNTKRRSAKDYVKGLSKPKGWARLAKDSVGVAKGASDFISSGKLMKGVNEVAGDARTLVGASKGLIGDKYYNKAMSSIDNRVNQVKHFHDVANQYNEQGKQLANQFQNQLMKRN